MIRDDECYKLAFVVRLNTEISPLQPRFTRTALLFSVDARTSSYFDDCWRRKIKLPHSRFAVLASVRIEIKREARFLWETVSRRPVLMDHGQEGLDVDSQRKKKAIFILLL